MKKNNQNRVGGKGRVLLVLFFLTISLSACSGLNLHFFGNEKADKTESKDKESNAENKGEKAEESDTEKKSKPQKQKNVKEEKVDTEKESEKTSKKDKKQDSAKVKVWNKKDKTQKQGDNTAQKPLPKEKNVLLTDKECREIILEEYWKYDMMLKREGLELNVSAPVGEFPDQYLYSVVGDDLYSEAMHDMGFDRGVNIVRERYPGPYMTYLLFSDAEGWQTFINRERWVPSACFYINLKTGMVFFTSDSRGIYRIPNDQVIWYMPDAYDGYANLDFLLSGLAETGYIESKWDYTWKYDLDNWDFDNPPYSEGEAPEGCARIMLFHEQTQEYLGCFDVEKETQSIYDVETGKLIYQNPASNYPKKKITAKNAAKETEDIVRKLEFLDFDKEKLTFLAGDMVFFEEIHNKAYSIGVKVGDDDHISYLFFINQDGTKVGSFNHVTQSYDIIYGNHMWWSRL